MTDGREQDEWGGQEGPDPRGHSATIWEVAAVAFLFVGVVALNALAWAMPVTWMTVVVYHLVLALGLCMVVPTWLWLRRGRSLAEMGLSFDRWPWCRTQS